MKRCILFSFAFFVTLGLPTWTYASRSVKAAEPEYGDKRHRATIRVESAELCPGQEVELGIYVDLKLGQPEGGEGNYIEGVQLPPDPLENFMFYLYVSDTSKAEVVCSNVDDRGNGYKVGYPVLKDLMPGLSGGNLTCGYIVGSHEGDLGKRGRFTCIWVKSRQSTELIPDKNAPLFKIRVRSKAAGPVSLTVADDANEIAFSTGLGQMGGYYYSFYNEPGKTPNRVPGMLVTAKGPDKALVSAGPDRRICIRDRVTFNAEGGMSYKWSQCYNPGISGGYQPEHLSDRNTKNPTFFPLHAGPYIYQVEAFDEKGCSTRDTVRYYVEQNYLNDLSITPDGTMIDSGSRVKFTLGGRVYSYLNPFRVTLEPDSLFAPGGNVLKATTNGSMATISGSLTTGPVYEPALITATFQDTVCKAQLPAVIRIKGLGVSGKIAPFPVYRCGDDREVKSLQLNLVTKGGSDKFLYNWRATDLEFTQFPGAAPKIDKPNSRTPKLTYYGRCAISVDIYDMETQKMVTISDTMIYRDWLKATTDVALDTAAFLAAGLDLAGPYCEGTTLPYKARSRYAGKGAKYVWQINGVWQEEGIDDTVFMADLRRGDSVRCVMYSTEACVSNKAVESKPFAPDIRYPALPSIEMTNLDPYGYNCNTVDLQATCYSLGRRFRMLWLRNGQVEIDTVVEQENPDQCVVTASFPRKGFYDGFTCMAVESDMPCGDFDTVYSTVSFDNSGSIAESENSNTLYPYPYTNQLPEAKGVLMPEEAVCHTNPFKLSAQIGNLTRDFELRWYRKSGRDSVLLGYYATRENVSLGNDYRLNGTGFFNDDLTVSGQIAPVAKEGFPITLNDPEASVPERRSFSLGDTVFFVLVAQYSPSCEEAPLQTCVMRSPWFVPQLIESKDPGVLTVDYLEKSRLCPGTDHNYHLVASLPGEDYYELAWTFENISVTDTSEENSNPAQYFKLIGKHQDTLQCGIVVRPHTEHGIAFGTWGACTATITKGCHAGHTQTAEFNLDSLVWDAPFFKLRHNPDTIVCADEPVGHWARTEEVASSRNKVMEGGQKTYKPGEKYRITWAHSLQDLLAETNIHEGSTYVHTPVPNGNTPDGSGDFDDNRGLFTYYVRAEAINSGCEVVDSILVMVGHPYQVEVSLDYLLPSPWCDSSDYAKVDPDRKVEGFAYVPGGQYAMLRITNGGSEPLIEWGLNDEVYKDVPFDTLDMAGVASGDTLKAWVTTSMYTCLPDRVAAEPLLVRSSRMGDLYAQGPESAVAGAKVLLEAYVGNHRTPSIGLGGYDYVYSMQDPDGVWQEMGKGSSNRRDDWIDSILLDMPARTGRFRVESRDQYDVCPVRNVDVDVTLAVSTNITMKAFDPVTKREIKGLCPQSYAFVYADGQPAPVEAPVFVNTTRQPMDVLIRTYPENPGGNAYVGYHKNGSLRAFGPVGTAKELPFDPLEEDVECIILERGDTITAHILPGDWFGAFYVHDTVSMDGVSTHYSDRITLAAIDTAGELVVTADPSAVCHGATTVLNAAFEKTAASVTWQPAGAFVSTSADQATAVVSQSTVYSAFARDANGCPWTDSVLVNEISDGGKLPLAIKADSLTFCGKTTRMRVGIDTKVSQSGNFSKFYWYAVESSANRLIDSTTEGSLLVEVADGMRLMVQGRAKLACQDGLSQSDTLLFTGFDYPHLKRLRPLLSDTAVCPLSDVAVSYDIAAENVSMQWYAVMGTYRELLKEAVDRFDYVADEDVRFEVTARNADMPACAVSDTVNVAVLDAEGATPQVRLVCDKDVVCGPTEVTYVATTLHTDRLIWIANGEVLSPNGTTLSRVPRITGFEGVADSVHVLALRDKKGCVAADTTASAVMEVLRVEKPVLVMLCRDTTVWESAPVSLQATASVYDGPEPVITWHDAQGYEKAAGSRYEVTHDEKGEYLYYAMAFQTDLEEVLPECYSFDSVTVTVKEKTALEEKDKALLVITPNPTSGKFTLQADGPARVEIYSLAGVMVWSGEDVDGKTEIVLGQSGIYFVKALTPRGTVIRKLVVR